MMKVAACLVAVLLSLTVLAPPAFADALPSAEGAVAQVTSADGTTTYYATFAEAVGAAPDGATVTLLADATLKGTTSSTGDSYVALSFGKSLVIDGAGHTVTVGGLGIYVVGSTDEANPYDIVFRNITLTNSDANGRVVSARNGYKTLTFDDVVMIADGAGNPQAFTAGGNTPQTTTIAFNACELNALPTGYGIITFNPVDLTLADTSVSGYGALYMKGKDSSAGSSGSTVNVIEGSSLSSTGIAGPTSRFGTIVLQNCDDVKVNVESSTVTARASDAEPATTQAVVMFSDYTAAQGDLAKGDTVVFGEGSTVKALGANSALVAGNDEQNKVEAKGGTFDLEGSVFAADDPTEAALEVTGGSWSRDMTGYLPEGYAISHEGDGPYVVAQTESRENQPTQPATPDGAVVDAGQVTSATTPAGSAEAAQATQQVSDPAARASVQQTGDGELVFMGAATAVIVAVSCALAARRRHAGGRC